jgi:hypothetical protein
LAGQIPPMPFALQMDLAKSHRDRFRRNLAISAAGDVLRVHLSSGRNLLRVRACCPPLTSSGARLTRSTLAVLRPLSVVSTRAPVSRIRRPTAAPISPAPMIATVFVRFALLISLTSLALSAAASKPTFHSRFRLAPSAGALLPFPVSTRH